MKAGRFVFCLLLLLTYVISASATHIVGGEVTYKFLGSDTYEITLVIYEDCLSGLPTAIAEDDPAYINIFDGKGNSIFDPYDTIQLMSRVKVPPNFTNECIKNPPATCLWRATFIKTYHLTANTTGYTFVYQRCCRNAYVTNLRSPASIGATYSCSIPPLLSAANNNSAQFKNYPPQIICINNPLIYDHSAYDPDGDSLSYELCQDYTGANGNDPTPVLTPPPFDPVIYTIGFSYSNPMGGYPRISIDPKTGVIRGTPNLLGRFSVTVCVHEWRNGVMINTVSREFQFVVTNCSKSVVADIPQYSSEYNTYVVDCKGFNVQFNNHSKGGYAYYWNFGDTANAADTSTTFEPSYTFPDTGVYSVTLVVNKGSTCSDSISRLVKIYPYFSTAYTFKGLQCPNTPLDFIDQTASTYQPIENWQWSFGDGLVSTRQNVSHTYGKGGTYNVLLSSQNIKGCKDTMLKKIVIDDFSPSAGHDTTIVKGQSIYFNAGGGDQYIWSPAGNLNDPYVNNPVGYFPDTGHFDYNVQVTSSFGCVGNDSVRIWVVGQGALFVPNAFTPNGDGKDDIFRPILIGYQKIKSFRVYNRWGQELYHTNEAEQGWDGTYSGRKADMGTYFWLLEVVDKDGKDIRQRGEVTLIR